MDSLQKYCMIFYNLCISTNTSYGLLILVCLEQASVSSLMDSSSILVCFCPYLLFPMSRSHQKTIVIFDHQELLWNKRLAVQVCVCISKIFVSLKQFYLILGVLPINDCLFSFFSRISVLDAWIVKNIMTFAFVGINSLFGSTQIRVMSIYFGKLCVAFHLQKAFLRQTC